jgi:hypothetical protein
MYSAIYEEIEKYMTPGAPECQLLILRNDFLVSVIVA